MDRGWSAHANYKTPWGSRMDADSIKGGTYRSSLGG